MVFLHTRTFTDVRYAPVTTNSALHQNVAMGQWARSELFNYPISADEN
jgi:hypothetical protein